MSQQSPEFSKGNQEPTDAELLEELKKVGSSLAFRREVRRILKIVAVGVLIALIASFLSIYAISKIRDYQEVACQRDNALRKAYTDQWNPVLKDSPAPTPPPDGSPKEVVEAYEAQVRLREKFIKGINEGFAQHSC